MVTAGDERAFSILYDRYHRRLFRYCLSILQSEADADDAVQSTFTAALEALQRNRRHAPVRPWVYRIAHNEAISLIRRRSAANALSADLGQRLAWVEDRAQDRERLEALLEDLQELPERPRGAILMRELGGLSHEEIALALGTSVSGAKQAIFQGRSALMELAEGRAMACQEVQRAISGGDRRVLRSRRVRAHLRDCPVCARFAAEMPRGRARLRALTAPVAGAGTSTAAPGYLGSVGQSFSAAVIATKGIVVAGVLAGAAGLSQLSPQPSVVEPSRSQPASLPAGMPFDPAPQIGASNTRVDGGPRLRWDAGRSSNAASINGSRRLSSRASVSARQRGSPMSVRFARRSRSSGPESQQPGPAATPGNGSASQGLAQRDPHMAPNPRSGHGSSPPDNARSNGPASPPGRARGVGRGRPTGAGRPADPSSSPARAGGGADAPPKGQAGGAGPPPSRR